MEDDQLKELYPDFYEELEAPEIEALHVTDRL